MNPSHLPLDCAPNPHLAFSSGIHRCLGALARLKAEIATPATSRHLPSLDLSERPRGRGTSVLLEVDPLTVRWDGTG